MQLSRNVANNNINYTNNYNVTMSADHYNNIDTHQ